MTEAALKQEKHLPDFAPGATQRAASEPNVSVWVNASAGTGKTTVLTNRVTRLLLSGVSPQRILCLTYTRAAAAEMALRVMERLGRWAVCSDNDLSASIEELQGSAATPKQMNHARKLFARVLACPGGMRIQTIHAFCQEILRRFPLEAGLAPHFAVIEESDARALQEDARDEVLREASQHPGSEAGTALARLAADLGEYSFAEAVGAILSDRARLLQAARQAGGLKKLATRMRSDLSLAPGETAEAIIDEALKGLDETDLRKAAGWLSEASKLFAPRGRKLLAWLDLAAPERAKQFDAYCRCFFTDKGEAYEKSADKATLAKYPELDGIVQKETLRLASVRERLEAAGIAEVTEALLTLGLEIAGRFEKRKTQQALLDYDDLIIRTEALLRRPGIAPWVLYKLDGGLDHILVDEAQDTSRAQWNIVAALAEEFFAGSGAKPDIDRTLFVVGDEKQSIFSFQRADPEAFEEYRKNFAGQIANAGKPHREVPMRISFRSAPAILEAVDAVFAPDAARAGVSHDAVAHRAFHAGKIGRVEIWPLIPAPPKEKDEEDTWALPLDYEKEQDPQAELAALIADKIKRDLEKHAALPGEAEPLRAGDIMILLRRRGRFADLMVRALKERGVPVTGVDRMRLAEQLPVMDLLALAQFALLPEDDLNLATVLKGPLLGLDDNDLMKLAIGRKGGLWPSLTDKVGQDARFAAAHGYLSRWLNEADFTTPFDFFAQILNETCPGSARGGLHAIWSRLGHDALDPVNELLNTAQDFSRRRAPSLQNFLHWLQANDSEIKRELDRGDKAHGGQVRIMTVHASKGLEAPVIYLPDAAGLPRTQDVPNIQWNGEAPFYLASRPRAGLARRLWEDARRRQLEEYRRLMYVALTRPANEIYIGGWEARGESGASWYELASAALKPLHRESALRAGAPQAEIVIADPELKAAKRKEAGSVLSAEIIPLPVWAFEAAPVEDNAIRPLSPSQFVVEPASATPDAAFARGRIIHRLLQSLPDLEDARRNAAAQRFLANPQHGLSEEQQKDISGEALRLLRDAKYAALFGAGSRAEVPLVGHVGGQPFAGRVDRLCVKDGEVWIVDYKTSRPPPKDAAGIPEAYRLQMNTYRAILAGVYPGKKIRCFLLWTYNPLFMEVPPESQGGA